VSTLELTRKSNGAKEVASALERAHTVAIAIASIGELLVEFVCADKDGRHRRIGTYSGPYPSGAPGIFIDQAARSGGQAIFVGAIGPDAFGQVILERLRADGVDDSLISVHPELPTGSAFVSYNADGSRDFVYNIVHSAAAAFEAGEAAVERLLSFGTDIIHVSGSALSNDSAASRILALCRALHGKGVRVSFDPNIRKELLGSPSYFSTVNALVEICSYFLPSEDDAAALFPGEALESFAPKLFARGAECVVLKRGDKGAAAIHRSGERHSVAAHQVEVADPTGAGDCFCGTFVTLFASGMPFRDALELANAAGALAVTKVGPMEGNSRLADLRAFLAAQP
jgi:sugar/nucleoside kinase (ribokinase family)